MPVIEIAAGIILNNGKILLGQRRRDKSLAFLWEFPGGKLESGETLEECLTREMLEEMALEIEIKKFFMRSTYNYDFGTVNLNTFIATCTKERIEKLTAHETYRWVLPDELLTMDLTPADIPAAKTFYETIKKEPLF